MINKKKHLPFYSMYLNLLHLGGFYVSKFFIYNSSPLLSFYNKLNFSLFSMLNRYKVSLTITHYFLGICDMRKKLCILRLLNWNTQMSHH